MTDATHLSTRWNLNRARFSWARTALALGFLVPISCSGDGASTDSAQGLPGAAAGSPAPAGAPAQPMVAGSATGPAPGGRAAPAGVSGSPGSAGAPEHGGSGGAGAAGAGGMQASGGGAAPAAGTGGAGGAGGTAGAGGATEPAGTCEKGEVKASEVVFIGESFIDQTDDIPRFLSQFARDAGTLGMSESYRSAAISGTQLTTGEIPMQYERAQSESPVKVVLMDGGGNDLLFGDDRCAGEYDQKCKEVVDVVGTLFKQMSTDGVKDVVYFFYPDPMGIGASIKPAMDILRPEMKKLCDETSEVRCVWVDQRESWEGNYDTFTRDGIHPTAAGSMASAKQIWDAMVANCIAQ